MNPILKEMYAAKNIEFPKIVESEVAALQEEVNDILEKTSDLYLKPGTRRERVNSPVSENRLTPMSIPSKIVSDISAIQRLFEAKIVSFKTLFRASENNFLIKEFHKKCDGQCGTLTLV